MAAVKPDNILVNYGTEADTELGGVRFTDVRPADLGSTVPATSKYAYDGDLIGAPIWRSPEAHIQAGWSIRLIYGRLVQWDACNTCNNHPYIVFLLTYTLSLSR